VADVRAAINEWTTLIVRVLLEIGCDPTELDELGESAIHVAAGTHSSLATLASTSLGHDI
jgi:hypothetical protein